MNATDYHAPRPRSHWSNSMFGCFADSPALAYRRYVLGEPGPPASTSMLIGSALNDAILLPGSTRVRVVDVQDRRTKAYAAAVESLPAGTVILTRPEMATVRAMYDTLTDPGGTAAAVACRALLMRLPGEPEVFAEWAAPDAPPLCCLVDRVLSLEAGPAIVELKTSRDPTPQAFARSFFEFGYHRQAAHNREGIAQLRGVSPVDVDYYVTAVRNSDPYDWHVYRIGADWMTAGSIENAGLRRAVLDRIEGRKPWCGDDEILGEDIAELPMPGWVRAKIERGE